MIDIEGVYTFKIPIQTMFLNVELKITGHNIITLFGESFFLNRCINDAFNPISYIVLGNGSNSPTKDDVTLGNETCRKRCDCEANLNNKQLVLTAKFKAKEVRGTSEIGVANDKILISHDTYQKFNSESLVGFVGDINVEYIFQFRTGSQKSEFKDASVGNNIYYIPEENPVFGVVENGVSGYRRVNSLQELSRVNGGYYYDFDSKNLYIRPIDEGSLENKEIIIQI